MEDRWILWAIIAYLALAAYTMTKQDDATWPGFSAIEETVVDEYNLIEKNYD